MMALIIEAVGKCTTRRRKAGVVELLETVSGIDHNVEDTANSKEVCWKEEALEELLTWISRVS